MICNTSFSGGPLKVVVIEDHGCGSEDGSSDSDVINDLIKFRFSTMPDIDLVFVEPSNLNRSIKGIPLDAEIIFIPFLRNSKRSGNQIITEIRAKRNGIPIIAWDDGVTEDETSELLEAGASYVSERTSGLTNGDLSYWLYAVARDKKRL